MNAPGLSAPGRGYALTLASSDPPAEGRFPSDYDFLAVLDFALVGEPIFRPVRVRLTEYQQVR